MTTLSRWAMGRSGAVFYGGWRDGPASRGAWSDRAFPVLAAARHRDRENGLAVGGLKVGPGSIPGEASIRIDSDHRVVLRALMYRPIRGECPGDGARRSSFEAAGLAQGAGRSGDQVRRAAWPDLLSTIVVLLRPQRRETASVESALSYFGAGVIPPNSSWGNDDR